MKQLKMLLLASMVILFTACGGGDSSSSVTAAVNPDTPQTTAIGKIKAYADDNTLPVPTVEDYIEAGIVGVTSENLDQINEAVDQLEYADVDTQEEIQALFDSLGLADNAPPTITLIGSATINLTIGDIYSEPGATATDNIDGDITANIAEGGDTVDTSTVGSYTITYNVSDSAGNAATEVTRTVTVSKTLDTVKPIITLVGNSVINLLVGTTYSDAGATANDNINGDITANIVVGGDTVDTSTVDSYTITYNVSDTAGNAATQVTRTVNVTAGNAPVITLNGDNLYTVEAGTTYKDPGATATDIEDGNVAVTNDSATSVNMAVVGDYTVTYSSTDSSGNTTQATRTVSVVDTTPPTITRLGDATVSLIVGTTYSDAGATANDNIDGDITANIVVGGDTVDTSTVDSYTITYNVSDAAGNAATQVTRTVTVTPDTEKPTITLIGGNVIVALNGTYTELEATAVDNKDGDISDNIVIAGTVDTATVGTYTITYNVSDSAGNAATQVTRTVTVKDADAELLLFNETRQFTESDNGFHILILEGDPLPSDNWATPHDFYNGEFRIRYTIESPVNQQAGKLQTCIWTWGNDGDGRDRFPESCSDQVAHNGVGTYYSTQIIPNNWWKKDGVSLDFAHPELFRIRTVLRGADGCAVTTWPVYPQCSDQWPNYENMIFRVTIVMVAEGTTFSGWENYPE